MSFSLPETLVLFVTTHGGFPLRGYDVETYPVPEGMTFTRFTEAVTGVCNLAREEDTENLARLIASEFKDGSRDPESIIRSLESTLKRNRETIGKTARQELSIVKDDTEGLFHRQEYLRYKDRLREVKTFHSGEQVLNKVFSRSAEEGTESAYDFKINMLNVPGQPDFIRYMGIGRTGPLTREALKSDFGRLNTAYLLEFLKSRGVKHVVMIDYSCGTMMDVDDPRTIRQARRGAIGKGRRTRKMRRKLRKTNRRSRK
jgi:hypothetical protein